MKDTSPKETSPSDISKTDLETLARFRYVLRRFLRFSEDAAAKVGLSPQQHQALLATRGFPGRDRVIVGELAERLQIRHHSTASLIDRLVAMDLLKREVDTKDRRRVWVSLTEKGDELILQLSAAHADELRSIGPQMTELLGELEKSLAKPAGKGHK
jgi:DNA-binding MarR family transcriptional regulator